jgi:hypothetical protein
LTPPATIASETAAELRADAFEPRERGRKIHWLRWFLLLAAAALVANIGGSWLVQHTRIRNSLNARLAAAFGRRVVVGHYSLSLWNRLTLVAEPIEVAEDPRFGNEYFLRADSLSLRLRWLPLLSGHVELGALSLSRPSLNLVRAPDGRWNIEEWLPAPTGGNLDSIASAPAVRAVPRIKRIEVDAGRVNFKRGPEKLPFASVDVGGWLEQNAPGQWQLNLDASPARAAVVLQQAGTLHVDGELGGTSSRLRPANLRFRWDDAALADASRLGTGADHGIRGAFSAALEAHTRGALWNLQGRAELRRMHGWDLSLRADNPAVNVLVRANWLPETSELDFSDITIEAPRSKVRASGGASWAQAGTAPERVLNVVSDGIEFTDLLAWVRAFRPGVSEALTARGTLRFGVAVSGWPPRVTGGTAWMNGASLEGGSMRVPISVTRASAQFDHGSARLLPTTIALGSADGALRIEGTTAASSSGNALWKLSGKSTNVDDIADAAFALGWSLPIGWKLEGPAAFDLQWPGGDGFAWKRPIGRIDLQGLTVQARFLNRPITQLRGSLEFVRDSSELSITSAQAFGGDWKGVMDVYPVAGERHFALSVDRLNAEDLDRWLNPRWREGFFGNMLPFLNSTPSGPATMDGLEARGRIAIDQFAFLRFVAHHLKGDLAIHARRLEFGNVDADFYGARVSGKLVADLQKVPAYTMTSHFTGLNLATLTAGSPTLARTFAGLASGDLAMTLTGIGRDALFASLECDGTAEIQNPSVEGFDLIGSLRTEGRVPGTTSFSRAPGAFKCRNGRIEISQARLTGPGGMLSLAGSVDPARNVDFRVRWMNTGAEKGEAESGDAVRVYQIEGPLLAPRISRVRTTPKE